MQPHEIDETTADLLVGSPGSHPAGGGGDLDAVVTFIADLRATTLAPPAPLSEPLAAILVRGLPDGRRIAPARRPAVPRQGRFAGWRRAVAMAAGGLALTSGGLTAATAANLLPAGVGRVVASVVESVTPFELNVQADPPPTAPSPLRYGASTTIPGVATGAGAPGAGSAPSAPSAASRAPGTSDAGPPAPASPAPATGPSVSVPAFSPSQPAGPVAASPTVPVVSTPTTPTTTDPVVSLPGVPTTPATTVPVSTPQTTLQLLRAP